MPIRDLKDQIARLPEQPGVYLYFSGDGETIYVGKARSLRDRVRSYLGAYGVNPKTDALLHEADRLEVVVTDSVVEALALENHLIKQRSPRYNILLRDDKNYPYLRLTTSEACPRVLVARRVERDGDFYAGPFLPAWFARRTMSLTHRLFGIRSCNEVITGQRGRPCLEYDIKRCLAPCVDTICGPAEYARAVDRTRLFLDRRNDQLLAELRDDMRQASERQEFERAAQLRDAIKTIQTLGERQQKIATARLGDRDTFGVKVGAAGAVVTVFQVRNGKVIDRAELSVEATGQGGPGSESEVLEAALQQFYEDHTPPPEVHVPVGPDDSGSFEGWLAGRAGRRVRLVVPRRGEKRGLLDLAARNATISFESRFNEQGASHYDALDELRRALALPAVPRRIECFDISTIQGSETVAALVVCENGRMRRSEYRKFRIRGAAGARLADRRPGVPEHEGVSGAAGERGEYGGGVPHRIATATFDARRPKRDGLGRAVIASGPAEALVAESTPVFPDGVGPRPESARVLDDFAAMQEVVGRRYRGVLEQGGPFPDLVVIDGGKGQLSAAYVALREIGLGNLVAIGLAKKEELVFTLDAPDPLALPPTSAALHLLQRIRDEAHRFAVTFHRRARAMRDLRSQLDDVPGIGPRRRKLLLERFGSLPGVRRATREELVAAIGAKAADAVLAHFAAAKP